MWQENFKTEINDKVIDFIVEQWKPFGLYINSDPLKSSINISPIDPEALLLFTLDAGRLDPRLYDEVIDWLITYESLINVQRLNNIMKKDTGYNACLLSGPAKLCSKINKSTKWKKLSTKTSSTKRDLFNIGKEDPHATWGKSDEDYLLTGWRRPSFNRRDHGKMKLNNSLPILILKLRSFFGLNCRAELCTYLLCEKEGHPTEIASATFYSQPSIFQVCREMETAGMIKSSYKDNRKTYALEKSEWIRFFKLPESYQLKWGDWPARLILLRQIWNFINYMDKKYSSDYLIESEIKRIIKTYSSRLQNIKLKIAFESLYTRSGIAFKESLTNAIDYLMNSEN